MGSQVKKKKSFVCPSGKPSLRLAERARQLLRLSLDTGRVGGAVSGQECGEHEPVRWRSLSLLEVHAIYLQIVCSRGGKPKAWSWQESLIRMHPILGAMAHKREVVAPVSV